jgi:hypothetical protein
MAAHSVSSSRPVCNLQVMNNTAPIQLYNNTVGGNLQLMNNTSSVTVFTNTVKGNLQCSGNNTSLISGGMNMASQKQGQCAGF